MKKYGTLQNLRVILAQGPCDSSLCRSKFSICAANVSTGSASLKRPGLCGLILEGQFASRSQDALFPEPLRKVIPKKVHLSGQVSITFLFLNF